MKPGALRKILDRLDLTQAEAAEFFDVSERQVRRWIRGEAPIPMPVELTLMLIRHYDLPLDEIIALKACRS